MLQTIIRGRSDANIRFFDLRALSLNLEFQERVRGSHRHFGKKTVMVVVEIINLQSRGRHAKPYQMKRVRQLVGYNPILVDQRVGAIDSGADALSGGVLLDCLVPFSDTHGIHTAYTRHTRHTPGDRHPQW